MVAKGMAERGMSVRQPAGQLGVTEGAPRYRLKKLEEGPRRDGRAEQPTALDGYGEAVEAIQRALGDGRLTGEGRPAQARQIYALLVRDHGYGGSYQAVVRHLRRKHGRPRLCGRSGVWRRRRGCRPSTTGSRYGYRFGLDPLLMDDPVFLDLSGAVQARGEVGAHHD